ncbi:MAG: hypothetical protein PHS59_07040 [Paludibacter sp.]|nr:hypothetical protein [Paludibacter sp.]
MKSEIKILVTAFSLFISSFAIAQDSESSSETFSPNGKPIVTIYSDFSVENSNGKSNAGFEVTRAYLGYAYNFSENFSAKVVFDVTNTAGLTPSSYTAFLKNAYTEYSTKNIKLNFGMISTTSFKFQESFWGKRYMYKSLQDEYCFESSADLGTSFKWDILPLLSLDLSVFNGEGYKKVQLDSTLKVAAGLTIEPIKNLYGRVYFDYMKNGIAQSTFNVFAGYKASKGLIGAEYNLQNANKMIADRNWSSVSIYGNYSFVKKLSVFGRFDKVTSDVLANTTSGWNSTDGNVYIAGIEYIPVKGIQITPNFRYSDFDNGSNSKSIYLNIGLNL